MRAVVLYQVKTVTGLRNAPHSRLRQPGQHQARGSEQHQRGHRGLAGDRRSSWAADPQALGVSSTVNLILFSYDTHGKRSEVSRHQDNLKILGNSGMRHSCTHDVGSDSELDKNLRINSIDYSGRLTHRIMHR